MSDSELSDIMPYFDGAVAFIEEIVKTHFSCLVHCQLVCFISFAGSILIKLI